MADTTTVAALVACAEWAAFKCFGGLLREVFELLPSGSVDGIEAHTTLVRRLHFFNVVDILGRLDYSDNEAFIELLRQMDELQNTYGPQLIAKGICKLKWLDQRHAIIVEMGMSLLRNKIEFGEDASIRIDPSFVFHDYRRLIKEMFRKHRKYSVEDDDDSCDIEDEDELINQTTADLCDILSRPQANVKPRKNDQKPNDVKLRILLIKHTVEGLEQKISTFVKHIESMVLPTPILTLTNEHVESVMEELREKDWTEKQARDSGPYAGFIGGRSSAGSARSSYGGNHGLPHASSTKKVPVTHPGSRTIDDDDCMDNLVNSPPAPLRNTMRSPNLMRVRAVDTRSSPGTLTRVGREFNAKVGQKDPLPDILSEMVVAPVDSRLTRKRPISDQSISRRKSDKRRVEESSTDEGNSDDEVLTEDQESVSREEEQEKATSSGKRKVEARKSVMVNSPSTHRRQHLHELPHYIDSEKQNSKEWIVKKKLTETRESAERVNFNDSEEQIDEDDSSDYHPDSDFNGSRGGDNVGQQLRRKAAMNVERQHQFPARLVRPRDSIERERNRNPNVGTRRKWTSDEEAALEEAVLKHGLSNWAEIVADEAYSEVFYGRTNINLKDKYRNLVKARALKQEEEE